MHMYFWKAHNGMHQGENGLNSYRRQHGRSAYNLISVHEDKFSESIVQDPSGIVHNSLFWHLLSESHVCAVVEVCCTVVELL